MIEARSVNNVKNTTTTTTSAYRWRLLPRVRRHKASKPQGSSKLVLPWQVTMDQFIRASLSHTHNWYEGGMLKVPPYYACNKYDLIELFAETFSADCETCSAESLIMSCSMQLSIMWLDLARVLWRFGSLLVCVASCHHDVTR